MDVWLIGGATVVALCAWGFFSLWKLDNKAIFVPVLFAIAIVGIASLFLFGVVPQEEFCKSHGYMGHTTTRETTQDYLDRYILCISPESSEYYSKQEYEEWKINKEE